MMQHVATDKSGIAAFATNSTSNTSNGSDANEQFGVMFDGQKSQHSNSIKSESPGPFYPKKSPEKHELDPSKHYPPLNREDAKTSSLEKSQDMENKKVMDLYKEETVLPTKTDKELESAETTVLEVEATVHSNMLTPTDDEESQLLEKSKALMQSQTATENVDAQQWVELIEKLAVNPKTEHSLSKGGSNSDVESQAGFKVDSKQGSAELDELIQQELDKLLTHSGENVSTELPLETAELLLTQPKVLQDIVAIIRKSATKSDESYSKIAEIDLHSSSIKNNELLPKTSEINENLLKF